MHFSLSQLHCTIKMTTPFFLSTQCLALGGGFFIVWYHIVTTCINDWVFHPQLVIGNANLRIIYPIADFFCYFFDILPQSNGTKAGIPKIYSALGNLPSLLEKKLDNFRTAHQRQLTTGNLVFEMDWEKVDNSSNQIFSILFDALFPLSAACNNEWKKKN